MSYQTPITIKQLRPHTGGQRALYLHPARFQIVACGRRFGKTEFGKLIATECLLRYGLDVWWVSPTYKMGSRIWRDFKKSIGQIAVWQNSSERVMEFPNGAELTIWTGEQADTMRGGAPGVAIVDEAAMIKDADMWPSVIRPALTDHKGRALFLSTPKGRNWFWQLYQMGQDPLESDYKSWNFPSVYNPFIPSEEIEDAKRTLPERFFNQEYMAEFIPDAGGVFRGVLDVSVLDIATPYYGNFVFGVDWGKEHDFTVISVFDVNAKKQVDIDRYNKISWELQRGRLISMYEKWKPQSIIAEHNNMGVMLEALQNEGLPIRPFQTNAQTKRPLIDELALAIERHDIMLLNDRTQIAELQAYEMERLPSGSWRYNAPSGSHDDTVIATALAWHGCINKYMPLPDWLQDYRG